MSRAIDASSGVAGVVTVPGVVAPGTGVVVVVVVGVGAAGGVPVARAGPAPTAISSAAATAAVPARTIFVSLLKDTPGAGTISRAAAVRPGVTPRRARPPA